MDDTLVYALEQLTAGLSIALMGLCGAGLLARLVRVIRGEEPAHGLRAARRFAPGKALLCSAAAGLASRLMLYVLLHCHVIYLIPQK